MRLPLVLFAALSLAFAGAAADTRMIYSTPGGSTPKITIKGDWIRMEGDAQSRGITLFDASTDEMTVIDPAKQNYYRMNAESVKEQGRQLSEQLRRMREQMERQLESLPEEQREMMRRQMEQMMPDQAAAETGDIRFERTGENASVAGIDCEISVVRHDGQPVQRVCVAAPGNLGMSHSDRDTLRSLFSFLQEVATNLGGGHMGARVPARMMENLDGVPIRTEDLEGGQSWTLQSVETGSVDAGQFSIPSNYKEVEPFSSGR